MIMSTTTVSVDGMQHNRRLERVLVLYNTDYDAELIAASTVDVSAVRESALAIVQAIEDYGLRPTLIGVQGADLGKLLTSLLQDPPDLVFNLCESLCGSARNEPAIPALLDTLAIPYTGSNALCLGVSLHKDIAKEILVAKGVRTPAYVLVSHPEELQQPVSITYPVFVKLAREDASVGIEASNVAKDWHALRDRAQTLLKDYRQPIVVERYVQGREFNVTLLEKRTGLEVLPLHEIDFSAMPPGRPHIVSYAAKWDKNHQDYWGTKPVPARDISPNVLEQIHVVARQAFRALRLRDFGRVDLRVDNDGNAWVIDVNP